MTAATAIEILFPPGRLVWGSVSKGKTHNGKGELLTFKSGPNKGQPRTSFEFGLAIPKDGSGQHWAYTAWGKTIWQVGHTAVPTAGQREDFSWKVTDGDSTKMNKNNRRPCDSEGFPGHWVIAFSSTFAPRLARLLAADGLVPVSIDQTPDQIRTGFYVEVAADCKFNDSPDSPGVYCNAKGVCLRAFGPEVKSGPDIQSMGFGQAAALPAGAMQVPVGGTLQPSAPPPGAGATPPPGGAAMPPPVNAAPPAAAAPFVPPSTPVQPNGAFMAPPPGAGAPPVPGVPVAPPAVPAGPVMTAKANGATYEQMIANGWTDALLRQHGMVA